MSVARRRHTSCLSGIGQFLSTTNHFGLTTVWFAKPTLRSVVLGFLQAQRELEAQELVLLSLNPRKKLIPAPQCSSPNLEAVREQTDSNTTPTAIGFAPTPVSIAVINVGAIPFACSGRTDFSSDASETCVSRQAFTIVSASGQGRLGGDVARPSRRLLLLGPLGVEGRSDQRL